MDSGVQILRDAETTDITTVSVVVQNPVSESSVVHSGVETQFFLSRQGIVVETQFASFFLSKLLGKRNSYYDLQSLDPDVFRNMQMLKEYKGDVEADFGISFTVALTVGGPFLVT